MRNTGYISLSYCLALMDVCKNKTQPEWSFLEILNNSLTQGSFWIIDGFAAGQNITSFYGTHGS
jgi:hypothetical protein